MKLNADISSVPIIVWIIFGVLLLVQGLWVFNDAPKRGMNRYIWGIFCLLNTPSNLLVYLIVSRAFVGIKECVRCHQKMNKKFLYCPYCGSKQEK